MLFSGNNTAEKDNPDNLSLAGDGFDTVIKAKEALESVPSCRNKVSCADILAMAARDVVSLVSSSAKINKKQNKIKLKSNVKHHGKRLLSYF